MNAASVARMTAEQRERWNTILGACRPPNGN
jgi:hypothetical protein